MTLTISTGIPPTVVGGSFKLGLHPRSLDDRNPPDCRRGDSPSRRLAGVGWAGTIPQLPLGGLAPLLIGEDYQDNLFACLFNLHKVTRHVLEPSGTTFKSRDIDFL